MQDIRLGNISTEKIALPFVQQKDIETDILRLDKIHPLISGNKWFKLRYYLEEAKQLNKKTILTFGGAWSNHILATAAASQLNKFHSIGIIRGEEPAVYSGILQQAEALGMKLVFISREDYSNEKIPVDLESDEYYIIAQGGMGEKGVKGAAEILDHAKKENYTHICCAAGTGTMMAGLLQAIGAGQELTGISVLKNNVQLEEDIRMLSGNSPNRFHIGHEHHFGGYAKYTSELIHFMNALYDQTAVPTDFVYTGKLCFAIADLIQKNFFTPGSRLLLIHSGGLSGNASLEKGTLIF